MMSRRCKYFSVSPELLTSMLTQGKHLPACHVLQGLPPGCVVTNVSFDHNFGNPLIHVVVQHDGFDYVEVGKEPELNLRFERSENQHEPAQVKFREFL
jgi:hypothetical protein